MESLSVVGAFLQGAEGRRARSATRPPTPSPGGSGVHTRPVGPQNLSVHLQLPFLAATVIWADIYLVDFPHFVRELQVG